MALDAVRQAAVVRQDGARGDRLVAHLVRAGDERPSDAAVRDALRAHLPEYMLPSAIVWHDRFPLTRNGKVDRARLTGHAAGVAGPAQTAEPDSEHRGRQDWDREPG